MLSGHVYALGKILEMTAGKYPRRTAIVYPEKKQNWDYLQWNEYVNRTAQALLKLGIVKGDRVSTFLTNNSELVTVLFAAARIGAVFNPINCDLSPSELAFILNDAESKVLVYGEPERKRVERARAKMQTVEHFIFVDDEPPGNAISFYKLINNSIPDAPGVFVSENDWYSIIYTSGTTGKQKGVIHRHRDIIDHSMCMIESQKLTYEDRGLSVSPLYHCAELHGCFIPRVHTGAASVICNESEPEVILNYIEKEEITVMFADPPKCRAIVQHVEKKRDFPHFRLMANGGTPMPPYVTNKWQEIFGSDVVHYYGMAEMGPIITVLYPKEQSAKAGSAGKPLLNHDIRVVKPGGVFPSDPEDTVETGEEGEVVVRGTGLMQGYYNRPEMTAEALYGGWYHTGDIGCFDSDGFLWILGRMDDAIISAVENIYPREIEEVLLEHPHVIEAAVSSVQNSRGETEIIAFLVCDDHYIAAEEIYSFLKDTDRLADFKIPQRYKFVKEIPKLTTGKVNKRKLIRKL